jgi:hypothetical protein
MRHDAQDTVSLLEAGGEKRKEMDGELLSKRHERQGQIGSGTRAQRGKAPQPKSRS